MRLHLDFETKSEVDLNEVGLDNYVRHPSTEILMLSHGIDDEEPDLWEPHKSELPNELRQQLLDPEIIKCAWYATFERTFLTKLGIILPYSQFCDSMIWARHLSMPGRLEDIAPILQLKKDEAKMEEGDRLKKLFTQPQKKNAGISPMFGTSMAFFRDWETDPEDWELFRQYCLQDNVSERVILKKLAKFPLPDIEQKGWVLDQKINEAGMPTDLSLVHGALAIAKGEVTDLNNQLRELTELENPNSRAQLLPWVRNEGYPFRSLGKDEVTRALSGEYELSDKGRAALKLRQKASKTSYKKYEAILLNVSPDGRLRNQFSFLGASRAGRWSGHDVQLHNLPRPTKAVEKKMDRAVELLRAGDAETITKEFPSTMDVVSSCVRAAFRAPEGKKLVVCDLNAIENRGLGWVARSKTILKVFEEGRCPYLDFATKMYKIPYEELAVRYEQGDPEAKNMRQVSKPAVLGCGYGLGGGEEFLNKDGDVERGGLWGYGENMGVMLTREQAHESVRVWRDHNPEVVQLWSDLEKAALKAVSTWIPQTVGPVTFECFKGKLLRILLPSGRGLHYIRPEIVTREFQGRNGPYTRESIYYDGINQTTRQWTRVATYGGKWTENIVQAIARDLLLFGLTLADAMGFEVAGHCHDEIIALVELASKLGLPDLRTCMMTQPKWALDFPLGAEGYEGVYYKKG